MMNSRRLMLALKAQDTAASWLRLTHCKALRSLKQYEIVDVGFGSLGDMAAFEATSAMPPTMDMGADIDFGRKVAHLRHELSACRTISDSSWIDHSPLIFAALTMGHHFSISAFCNAPSASGVC